MPVHHLLGETLNEYIAAAGLKDGQPAVPKREFAWNSGDGTSSKPVQCLGGDS
jgi:hypothetical protein